MTVHMIRVMCEPPKGEAETAINNWVANYSEWTADPVEHSLTETNVSMDESGTTYVRGDWRFDDQGEDPTDIPLPTTIEYSALWNASSDGSQVTQKEQFPPSNLQPRRGQRDDYAYCEGSAVVVSCIVRVSNSSGSYQNAAIGGRLHVV